MKKSALGTQPNSQSRSRGARDPLETSLVNRLPVAHVSDSQSIVVRRNGRTTGDLIAAKLGGPSALGDVFHDHFMVNGSQARAERDRPDHTIQRRFVVQDSTARF